MTMYWFLGILGVIAVFIAINIIKKIINRKKREREETEWKAYVAAREAERKAKEVERKERVPEIYLKQDEIPFELDDKQIIYVENEYDEAVNNFIVANYKEISNHFKSKGYEFCYLPMLSSEFDIESRKYHNPTCDSNSNVAIKSDFLLNYLENQTDRASIKPSLLFVNEKGHSVDSSWVGAGVYAAKIGDISNCSKSLSNILWWVEKCKYKESPDTIKDKDERSSYSLNRDDDGASYSLSRDDYDRCPYGGSFLLNRDKDGRKGDFLQDNLKRYQSIVLESADETFDEETKDLVAEIKEKVERLEVKGISKYLLEQILFGPTKLSRMVITHDFRILLPDYDNMEIAMTPLVKAVYILFLSHDEGIPFKSLADYRKELLGIYLTIKGESEPTEDILKSISAITDPFNNSINEKCARIREAFISQFDEHLAQHYFVTGKRGEPKKIALSRDLVEWE